MSSTRSFAGFVLPISLPLYFWKRTQLGRRAISALCLSRRSDLGLATSGLPRSTDIDAPTSLVRFVPEAVSEPEIIAPPIEPIVDRPFNFNTDAFAHRSQQ
jgi:hypothetical protein